MKLEQIIDICKEVQTRPGYTLEVTMLRKHQVTVLNTEHKKLEKYKAQGYAVVGTTTVLSGVYPGNDDFVEEPATVLDFPGTERIMFSFKMQVIADANTNAKADPGAYVEQKYTYKEDYVENWRLEDVLGFIYSRFIELETHEQKEFLKYKGKRFFNPHPELPKNEEVWL